MKNKFFSKTIKGLILFTLTFNLPNFGKSYLPNFNKRSFQNINLDLEYASQKITNEKIINVSELRELIIKNNDKLKVIKSQIEQSKNIWKTREFLSYAQKKNGLSIKHDISLPISKIPMFIKESEDLIKKIFKDPNILIFGHLADGNIHYNVSNNNILKKTNIDFYSKKVNTIVFDLVYKYNGSFSAEHGIGKMKVKELIKYTTSEEVNVKKQIKKLFDPNGIMNPGKVFGLNG